MAPKTTTTKATPAKGKAAAKEEKAVVPAKKAEKAVSTTTAADLAKMAMAAGEADKVSRASDGATFSYVSLAKEKTKALDEDEKDFFIPGLQMKEFFVQSIKARLGKTLEVVPLMFLTVYAEYDSPSGLAKFCGIWHKDDAAKLPSSPGSNFNKELPNGHEVRPQKWVFLYIPGHPELVNPVLTYKSTGNKIARDWIKDLEGRQLPSCQAIYTLSAAKQTNGANSWLDVGFKFEGQVYEIEDGSVNDLQGYAEEVLTRKLALEQAYNAGLLIQRKSVDSIRQVERESEDDDLDDEDAPAF